MSTTLYLDSFELVEEIVVPLRNYTFKSTNKSIVKRKEKKRKIEIYEENPKDRVIIFNVAHLNDEEFFEETTYALGEFVDANKWSIANLTKKLRKEKKQVAELQEKLKTRESLLVEEHQCQIS